MLHIVFQEMDVTALQKAIELDNILQGEVFEIKDDFAVGPINDIYTEDGYNNRFEWWKMLLEFSPYTNALGSFDDRETVKLIQNKLEKDKKEEAWLWIGQNQHDVCGYYWLISQLKDFLERIQVLFLHNLPFINEKGNIFYPATIHEIQPKEILKTKRLARYVTLSEFEIDTDEWKKLCNENATVRISEGGKKIVSKESGFYDKDIFNVITNEPQKLYKILHTILGKMSIKTGDVYLVWRMRKLAEESKLEIQGDWNKGWKDVLVKLKVADIVETAE